MRVLSSVGGSWRTTGYVVPLEQALAEGNVDVLPFSWPSALIGRYDVLHLHWPEYLLRHRRPWAARAKRVAFRMMLWRIRTRGTPVVRTVHNLSPHDGTSTKEDLLLGRLDDRVAEYVVLNETTRTREGVVRTLIPHGHYRHLPEPAGIHRDPTRLLYFGIIKPYKGLATLLAAFERVADQSRLRVVGRVIDADRAVLRSLQANPRISTRLEYVSDEELTREILEATLVVLPIRDLHNSGSLLRALSLNRPVLVPETPATRSLAAEAGENWVMTYSGELTPATLERALRAASSIEGSPNLAGRDWGEVADAYVGVFRRVMRMTN